MKASVIITTYNRPALLMHGLVSLSCQNLDKNEVEIIVLNDGNPDDGTKGICELFDDINIKYFSTKRDWTRWRVPGYAINHGLKQSSGDFIFLSCAEMYHMDKSIEVMIEVLQKNRKALAIPIAKDDDGRFLKKLDGTLDVDDNDFNSLEPLVNVRFPFFMGMDRNEIIRIGGYDEEYTGIGFDDNDIIQRLNAAGCHHVQANCRVVHLYHPRLNFSNQHTVNRLKHNERLFYHKRSVGSIVRNANKDWGSSF